MDATQLLRESFFLTGVVNDIDLPPPFISNSFFSTVRPMQTQEIYFDIESNRARLAAFVSPHGNAQTVKSKDFVTKSYRPAYIKIRSVFNADSALNRLPGEQFGGTASPTARMTARVNQAVADHRAMIDRRIEVMAIEALLTGGLVIEGDQYPTQTLSFGRDAALTKTLSGATAWGASGVKPLQNVQDWSLLVTQKSGATASTLIMDWSAYKLFSADPDVITLLDRFRGNDRLSSTITGEGATYMGNIGNFDIWVYGGYYEHPTSGAQTPYLPANTVLLMSQQLEGVRAFGMIQDLQAGYTAQPYFAKMYDEEEPSARYLITASAPLTVPYRVNASLAATVA